MNLLEVKIEKNPEYGLVVSSRVIANELGKRHADVLESLDRILENGDFRSLCIPSTYKVDGQQREYKEYLLTKDGFTLYMFNIQGYNEFKMAYINKFNEMEKALSVKQLPKTYSEALRELADSWDREQALIEENTKKDIVIAEMKPKVSYYDIILSSTDCMTVTQIGKDYGLSAKSLNQILNNLKIQYKQSGQWLLYQKYAAEGYTKSETTSFVKTDGSIGTNLLTKWTQKGRLFLYELLKDHGHLPLIEQEED